VYLVHNLYDFFTFQSFFQKNFFSVYYFEVIKITKADIFKIDFIATDMTMFLLYSLHTRKAFLINVNKAFDS